MNPLIVVAPLLLIAPAQQLPGDQNARSRSSMAMDPAIPNELSEVVARASEAELDKKRGTGNAIEILKAEKSNRSSNKEQAVALDLRIAATVLRGKFVASQEFPEATRYEQALSTFSRLDLAEPGLPAWIDRALEKNPEAKKKIGKKGTWKLKAAILTRGSSLDKGAIAKIFQGAFQRVGVSFEIVPAKEAPMVLTVAAEDVARPQEGDNAVRVSIGLESIQDGKVVWRDSLYRIEAAHDPAVALKSGLEWLARIGGRDLFFRWLGEHAFPSLMDSSPRGNKPGDNPSGQAPRSQGITPLGTAVANPTKVELPKSEEKTGAAPKR